MSDKCTRCEKSIYANDKPQRVTGGIFHGGCFRCKECQTKLTMKTCETNSGEIYCSQHKPDRFAKQ
eukprot:m.25036 g.25036  ORF g.25036 m.25036 type:complete len:66 (+) comp13498_c0_seq1:174-371(+)